MNGIPHHSVQAWRQWYLMLLLHAYLIIHSNSSCVNEPIYFIDITGGSGNTVDISGNHSLIMTMS